MTGSDSRPLKWWVVLGGAVFAVSLCAVVLPTPDWLTSSNNVNASVQQSFDIPASERRHIGMLDLSFNNFSDEEMKQAQAISEQLRIHLGQLGLFEVVERSTMASIMEEVESKDSRAGDTTDGLVQVGEVLGVTEMLGGSVSKVGSLYSIQLRLIDVITSSVIEGTFLDATDLSDLVEFGVPQVVQSLGEVVYQRMQSSLDESGHFSFSPDRERVGVMRLEPVNVSPGVADAVTERLGFFLGRTSFAQVLEREYIEEILEEMGYQLGQGAPEDSDRAAAQRKVISAKKVVAGQLTKAGTLYSLQIRVIDVDRSRTEFETLIDAGTIEEVLGSAVPSVVIQLEEHYRDR